ncbi:outer membrane beta-barrel protein [Dyella sp. M7H15-1]|uniref:outer membrane protein n=1 Tax=Dyella sp. M7H15-1 TaxID=2501295 RepID=UPI0013E8EC1F|nr:outer membrane beta-barrel protein [Dyella sp. M7H15-1]
MNKLALSAAVAALALSPVLSQAAPADDTSTATYGANVNPNWQDNFFVAGNLGQTQARTSELDHKNSVFQNVRFGWRWNGIIGPELGYVYLGRPKADIGNGLASLSAKPQAATIGLNAKYNFYQGWYVTGHAGYLRSRTKATLTSGDYQFRDQTWNNGLYAGLGIGYDVTKNVSVALNYDDYRIQTGNNTDTNLLGHSRTNIAAYSASVEYRF